MVDVTFLYLIYSPSIGPVTGNIPILISGIDFPVDSANVVIRFGDSKHVVDVTGEVISSTSISCLSPDFSNFLPTSTSYNVHSTLAGANGYSIDVGSFRVLFYFPTCV